jgi:hypothetical protein
MANTQTNLMLNTLLNSFNTGAASKGFKPGIPVALIFAPTGSEMTEANMLSQAAFITAMNALTLLQGAAPTYSRIGRAYVITGLDGFKPETKKVATTDTGLYQEKNVLFPNLWNFIVKSVQNNWSNYKNLALMSNITGYGFWVFDSNGNFWGTQSTTTPGNLRVYSLQQLFVDAWMPQEPGQVFEIPFSIQFASVTEFTTNFAYYQCPNLSATSFLGLENVVLQTAPAAVASAVITANSGSAAHDVVIIGKYDEGAGDLFQDYGAQLTAACFAGYDLTAGAALTISTFAFTTNTQAGVVYYTGYIKFSTSPTSGDLVQVSFTAPPTVYGVISKYVVAEVVQPGVDGSNCAVKTF